MQSSWDRSRRIWQVWAVLHEGTIFHGTLNVSAEPLSPSIEDNHITTTAQTQITCGAEEIDASFDELSKGSHATKTLVPAIRTLKSKTCGDSDSMRALSGSSCSEILHFRRAQLLCAPISLETLQKKLLRMFSELSAGCVALCRWKFLEKWQQCACGFHPLETCCTGQDQRRHQLGILGCWNMRCFGSWQDIFRRDSDHGAVPVDTETPFMLARPCPESGSVKTTSTQTKLSC